MIGKLLFSAMIISPDESRKGSGRSRTALTTVKMAVFAPMPSARVMMAIAENEALLASRRKA